MNFTFDKNPAAESLIQRHQSRVAAAVKSVVPADRLAAIVMIGGYGRKEGAYVVAADGSVSPYNDYDYFVVFKATTRTEADAYIQRIPHLDDEFGIEVDFFPLLAESLDKLEFSLMNAEMKAGHAVIWGDTNVLTAMPDMPLNDVPMAEFRRLLTNRGCLLLMNRLRRDRTDLSKFINKAWLAIGDTKLAQAGQYRLSYLEKQALAESCLPPEIARPYCRAVDIRLRPDLHQPWAETDMIEVTNAWLQTINELDAIKSNATSLLSALANVARHLRDRHLPLFDRQVFQHPRQRVTERLVRLLNTADKELPEDRSNDLLTLWGRYS